MTIPVPFPDPPRVSAHTLEDDAPILRLAPTRDVRPDKAAGRVGGLKLEAGSELLHYIDAALREALVDQGYRVMPSPDPEDPVAGRHALRDAPIVVVELKRAHIDSSDASMDPADAEVVLVARVYGEQGQEVYRRVLSGNHTELIGFFRWKPEEVVGELLAKTAKQAVDEFAADPDLHAAVTVMPAPSPETDPQDDREGFSNQSGSNP